MLGEELARAPNKENEGVTPVSLQKPRHTYRCSGSQGRRVNLISLIV